MLFSGVLALVLIVVTLVIPAPYVIFAPGPTFNTLGHANIGQAKGKAEQAEPLIQVSGHQSFPASGNLNLVTIYEIGGPGRPVSIFNAYSAWLDPHRSVLPEALVYPPDVSHKQIQHQDQQAMASSQQSAIAAALTHLGIDYRQTLTVARFGKDAAAKGVLRQGDILKKIDGQKITDVEMLRKAVNAAKGKPVTVVVERDGETKTVTIDPHQGPKGNYLLGVFLSTNFEFPFKVNIELNRVGGPSAGMMFALGIIDTLTPGDLTGGKHFAGTGTIEPDGAVGPIGGIAEKMVGARSDGADVFLAPAANCPAVVGHVPDGLRVVKVKTLDDAVAAVKEIAAKGKKASVPSCSAG